MIQYARLGYDMIRNACLGYDMIRYACLGWEEVGMLESKKKVKFDLGSSIEGEESKDKDESSKSSKRHRVARDVDRFSVFEPVK